jgi:MFS family permease
LLTGAAVVSALGSSGATVATAFAVLAAGGGSTGVGLVAAAKTVPLVVFLLVGGALADRLPRQYVMAAANLLSCLAQAASAALVLTGTARVWQLAVLAALAGTGQAFFQPAADGMLLTTVDVTHAARALSVFRMGMNGATIGGAALSGALVAGCGPGWALAVDAASFLVAGVLRARLPVPPGAPARRAASPGLLHDLRTGWREFTARRWLWAIVAQFSVVNAVTGATESVYGPIVSARRLGGAGPWGAALAAYGVGLVLGGLATLRWRPRRMLLAGVLAVFPYALPAVALAVVVPPVALAGVMLLAGASIEVFGVSWMTTLHQEIPADLLSRVSSYDWLGSVAMLPIGTAVAGPVSAALGVSGALWACGSLIVLLTSAVLLAPEVRRLTRAERPVGGAAGAQPTEKAPPGGTGESTASAS